MTNLNTLLLASCTLLGQLAFGQTDTIVIAEPVAPQWSAGILDSLDATTDTLKLMPVRSYRYTFTNCGQTGQNGPTQAQCNTAYTGTQLAGTVTVNAGIQDWTAPETGVYQILAAGAGHNADPFIQGAILRANFELNQSDPLKVLVGQMGSSTRGGNGGTFVTHADTTPIIVAGGAAGMRAFVDAANRGSTSTNGQSAACREPILPGGSDGGGGLALGGGVCSGAGGGLLGNGQECGGGLAFINGGTGGTASYVGGFGGGGGVDSGSSPGGGGGYSGGSVQYTGGTSSCAGGGGSYIEPGARGVGTSDGSYDDSTTFNGNPIGSFNDWRIGQGLVVMDLTQYMSGGARVSPEHDISTPATPHFSSAVEWRADVFTGTSLTVETRLTTNGGSTWGAWTAVTNGSAIPGLLAGTDMSAARVQTRMTFASTVPFASPMVYSLAITVINGIPTGITEHRGGSERLIVYPNPFENTFKIGYTLAQQSKVGVRLITTLGQSLPLMEATTQPAGEHVREFNLAGLQLAPGVYWVEIVTDGQAVREKLVRR